MTTSLKELILELKTEYSKRIIAKQCYDEYVLLVHYALELVLHGHPALGKEAANVTEPKIKLFWEIVKEKDEAIAELQNK